jgi:hypothetical protein
MATTLVVAQAGIVHAQILPRRRLPLIPRSAHPWARFMPGAWRTVDTETIIFVSETSYLNEHEDACHLRTVTWTSVPGNGSVPKPKDLELPISLEGKHEVKRLEDSFVTIEGQKHRTEVRQATIAEKTTDRIMTVHLAEETPAQVLLRETKLINRERSEPQAITRTEVVRLKVPRTIAGEERQTWEVKTIHENPTGKVETTEYLCKDVPGEMVYQKSEEFDSAGRLIRRSTVELTEFGKDNIGPGRFINRLRERKRREL